MFSLDIVKQFYVKSIVSSEARANRYIWVNGEQVYYDKYMINDYLDNTCTPYPSNEHDLCAYQEKISATLSVE
ncbi:hypothetical protein TanjilG_18617 [Lupinus angustifolius]|uniref:Uncharacterized protein n=1 Tax=Lupinus angustifolius TaxID=3871 RepID=A0A1J7IVX5_LUPAN|nr:hypothetical protein TanjilG_18617 [Lupinus angustifolius]